MSEVQCHDQENLPAPPRALTLIEGEKQDFPESFFDESRELVGLILPDLDDTKLYNEGVITPTTRSRLQHLLDIAGLAPVDDISSMMGRYKDMIKKKRRGIALEDHVPPLAIAVKTILERQDTACQMVLATTTALDRRETERQEEGKPSLGGIVKSELCCLLVYTIDEQAFQRNYSACIEQKLYPQRSIH